MRALARHGVLSQNWRQWWAEALLFDALIGNADRYQDNWGIIFESARRQRPNMPSCRLAPLFDNGTSLGHERFPGRVAGWTDARVDLYIQRGTHHVKSSLEPGHVQGHLTLLSHVLNDWAEQIDLAVLRARIDFTSADLVSCLADSTHLRMPQPFSLARMQFVCRLLSRRHALVKELLNVPAASPR